MLDDKPTLLQQIEHAWSDLQQFWSGLDESQMVLPDSEGWSIKDNLAHLAAWEEFLLQHHLLGRPAHEALGLDQTVFQELDEAGINAVILQRNRHRPLAEVLADSARVHDLLLFQLRQTPAAILFGPDAGSLLESVVSNTTEHYGEHGAMIGAFLNQIG